MCVLGTGYLAVGHPRLEHSRLVVIIAVVVIAQTCRAVVINEPHSSLSLSVTVLLSRVCVGVRGSAGVSVQYAMNMLSTGAAIDWGSCLLSFCF